MAVSETFDTVSELYGPAELRTRRQDNLHEIASHKFSISLKFDAFERQKICVFSSFLSAFSLRPENHRH